ncbi:radial spoke head 10 homolog B isoform X1 [Hydra vulgaris]|uniref:radial spoke head 10 homolog B isoform X1 n=1 Tax=Hydra vulgaris TaxID=6087 RepID=UPI001F5EA1A1|nr:radial spoke head 10 homolog B-like isoform X1 [Hydra vulgaris]
MDHKSSPSEVTSIPVSEKNVWNKNSLVENKDDMKCNKSDLFNCIIEQMEGDIHSTEECSFWLDGGLFYKGNVKNCKMHGFGVVIWPDKTEYRGELNENNIVGTGSYIWPDGSSYTGCLTNGIPQGSGVHKWGNKTYSGLWKEGKRHGKGILYYDDSGESYYDGDWYEDKQQGYGVRRYKNGNIYKGQFFEYQRHGTGTMNWFNIRQEYTGEWLNGLQNGNGTYTWYMNRSTNSQYPFHNHYIGKFLNGQKHGIGTFRYANGAFYEGEWKNDMKHGRGKFVFKNGCSFKGEFQENRIVEFPDLVLSGMTTPDITKCGITVISPSSPCGNNLNTENNVIFFEIDIREVLFELNFDCDDSFIESKKITDIMLRFFSQIKQIYRQYSKVGREPPFDNTLTNIQFCRFLKDYGLHTKGASVSEIAAYIDAEGHLNDPLKLILLKDFLNYIVKLSFFLYKEQFVSISCCFEELMSCLCKKPFAIAGYVFANNSVALEALKYMNSCKEVFKYFSDPPYNSLTVHCLIMIFKELKILNENLTCSKLVLIIRSEDEEDSVLNINREICFLEFFEILVGCASIFQKNLLHGNEICDSSLLKIDDDQYCQKDVVMETCFTSLRKFFDDFLFPAFSKRKMADEILKSDKYFQRVDINYNI